MAMFVQRERYKIACVSELEKVRQKVYARKKEKENV
jgi:hypothetical protein